MPRGKPPPEYLVEFTARNACVKFYDDHYTRFRSSFIAFGQPIEAVVHGFTEYTSGYQRLTSITAATPEDARFLSSCERRPLAIGVPFSCNNVYHQAFHAVPAFELWRSAAAAAGDAAIDYIPLIYPSAAVSRKMSDDPIKWHAWEFSVRPFTRRSGAEIAAATTRLLHAPCTCYDTVHGNAPAFNPLARTVAMRLRRFRKATLRSLRVPSPDLSAAAMTPPSAVKELLPRALSEPSSSAARAMLWVVRRHALRNIANDEKLTAGLAAELTLARRIRRVALEEMALAQQASCT